MFFEVNKHFSLFFDVVLMCFKWSDYSALNPSRIHYAKKDFGNSRTQLNLNSNRMWVCDRFGLTTENLHSINILLLHTRPRSWSSRNTKQNKPNFARKCLFLFKTLFSMITIRFYWKKKLFIFALNSKITPSVADIYGLGKLFMRNIYCWIILN